MIQRLLGSKASSSTYLPWHSLLVTLCLAYFIYRVTSYIRARATWKAIPTVTFPISPMTIFGNVLPHSKKWNPGAQLPWSNRNELYTTSGSETVLILGLLMGIPTLYTSSPEVFHQLLSNKAPWSKPAEAKNSVEYANFTEKFMGPNLVASDGDVWKTHRKVVSPAFSNDGYKRVWAETLRTYHEMLATEGWNDQDSVVLPSIHMHTRKLTLFIIASCGFNIPLRWSDGDVDKNGQMSFQAMMATVARSILIRWLVPKWAYYLQNKHLQQIDTAYNRLESFLLSQIDIRKKEIQEELESGAEPLESRRELFSRLVAASVSEGKLGLSDREIVGNTFILLFAGHETTAHTLEATLILLGLYEEEQEKVHNHVVSILGDRVITFEDYNALETVIMSAVYETLRLYPAVYMGMRIADHDTNLSLPKMDGSGTTDVFVPKGTKIAFDLIGAGYNRRRYSDVNSFKPSRWEGHFETSFSFSSGPRSCVGRKFATTEMVCFLSLMLRDWEVHVSREESESREQWRERLMNPKLEVSMELPRIPLRLVRRRRE